MKKGGEQPMKKMTLREHYLRCGSHMRGAEDLGVSTNNYALWLSGKYKPCWKSIQMLDARGISLESFPD
jgi:hypothetical protein